MAIGTATANELNTTEDISVQSYQNNILSESSIDSSAKSWNDAKLAIENASEGSTVYLNGSTYIADNESEKISITKNIIIVGGSKENPNNVAILDGNGLIQIISTTAHLSIINVKFINADNNSSGRLYGNVIYSKGKNLTLINCSFVNNHAVSKSSVYGGVIYISAGNLSAFNCNFLNNSANSHLYSSDVYGGVVYVENGNIEIENCNFINSSAYSKQSTSASVWGGVFYLSDGYLTVINSTFVNNSATSPNYDACGGVFYIMFGDLTINNCSFINNYANSSPTYNSASAGVIYVLAGDIDVINSIFINNYVYSKEYTSYGGVVFLSSGDFNVVNSSFINNSAISKTSASGGAIFISAGMLNAINCSFINNSATKGGAIMAGASTTNIHNSYFKDNAAKLGAQVDINKKCNLNLYNNSFSNGSIPFYISNDTVITSPTFVIGNVSGKYKTNVSVLIKFTDDNYNLIGSFDNYIINFNDSPIVITFNNKTNYFNGTYYADRYVDVVNSTVFSNLTDKINFNVTGIPAKMILNYSISESNVIVTASLNTDGEIEFYLNGVVYEKTNTKNQVATLYLSNLDEGKYNVSAKFLGNKQFSEVEKSTSFEIFNRVVIVANPVVMYKGNNSRLVILVTDFKAKPLADYNLTISVNGVSYNKTTDKDGVVALGLNGLLPNVYNVSIVSRDVNETVEVNTTVTVLSTIIIDNLTKMYKNSSQLYAALLDGKGKPISGVEASFNINGQFYKRLSDSKGLIRLDINLRPGEYIVTVYNDDSKQYGSAIVKVISTIISNNLTKYYKNNTQYYATILDARGNPVGAGVKIVFNINGMFYDRETDGNGVVKLTINLAPGTYIITATCGTLSQSNVVTVLSTIQSENIEMTTSNRQPFTVVALDGKGVAVMGVHVVFNINGIFYDKITDNNGIAFLNINLMVGSYIITSILDNGLMQSNTVTIKD